MDHMQESSSITMASNAISNNQVGSQMHSIAHNSAAAATTKNSDNATSLESLRGFLRTAPTSWVPGMSIRTYQLPNKEIISCVLWRDLFHITGTDIVRVLTHRFECFGRRIVHTKKFEEGIFSDLRALKPGVDATLEEPRSPFLKFLYEHGTVRTQKKQKVFFWFSVDHDRLFMDALERDLKRERARQDTCTVSLISLDPQESMQRAVQFISMASFNSIPHSTSGNLVNEFVIKHQPQTMPIMMPSMAPTRAAMSSSFGGSSVSSVSENLRYTEGQDRISPELITPSPEFDIDAALRGDPFGSTGVFPIPPGNNMGTNGSFPIKNSVMMDKLGKLQDFRVGPLTTLKRDSSNSSIRSCNSSPDTKGQHVCQFPTCGRHFKRQDQLFRHVRSHSTSATESRHKRQNSHGSQGSFLDYSDTESVDSLPVRFTYGTNIAANQNNASMIVNNTYHQPSPLVMNSVPMMMNSTPVIMKGSVASKHPGSTIVMGKSAMLMGNGSMLMHQNTNIPMKNDPSIHSSPVPTQSGNTRSSSPNINLMHTQNDFMHDISAKNPDQSFMNSLIMASRPQQIQTMPLSYPANDSSTNQSLPTPTTMLVSSIIHEPDSAANFGSNFLTFDPNDLLHPFEALNNVCEPQAFFN